MDVKVLEDALKVFLEKELPRLQRLEDYFVGKHEILNKKDRSSDKKDTKLVHNYPGHIVTISTAYFLGKPINYKILDESLEGDFERLGNYLTTEEEQQENFEHAENCSIYGKSYELWYVDVDREPRCKVLDPRDVFILRDNSIEKNIIAAVRWDMTVNEKNEKIYTLEVYEQTTVTVYTYTAEKKEIPTVQGQSRLHGFNQVPLIEVLNNKRAIGDFEQVISLIDGYNEANSTSIDDMKDFTDAYLVLVNMNGTDEKDIKEMKANRVMLLGEDSEAKWLVKDVNDTYAQNNKNRLNQDIHKFSFIPDMQDKEFAGNSSGVALGYKLLALEQLAAKKEMYFKKAINQRLELLISFYNLKIKPADIQKIFTRNTPENLVEIADVVMKLQGSVSKETLLSMLPFVEDVKAEIEKIEKESSIEQPLAQYGDLKNE